MLVCGGYRYMVIEDLWPSPLLEYYKLCDLGEKNACNWWFFFLINVKKWLWKILWFWNKKSTDFTLKFWLKLQFSMLPGWQLWPLPLYGNFNQWYWMPLCHGYLYPNLQVSMIQRFYFYFSSMLSFQRSFKWKFSKTTPFIQENCNAMVSNEYSEGTRRAMTLMNEKELPFELIDSLLKYIHGLGIPGAILIFLPGWNLIFALHKHLKEHPFFGRLWSEGFSCTFLTFSRSVIRVTSLHWLTSHHPVSQSVPKF